MCSLVDGNKFQQPRVGKNNDNSHPPIHPTKPADGLTGREHELYETISNINDFYFYVCDR